MFSEASTDEAKKKKKFNQPPPLFFFLGLLNKINENKACKTSTVVPTSIFLGSILIILCTWCSPGAVAGAGQSCPPSSCSAPRPPAPARGRSGHPPPPCSPRCSCQRNKLEIFFFFFLKMGFLFSVKYLKDFFNHKTWLMSVKKLTSSW